MMTLKSTMISKSPSDLYSNLTGLLLDLAPLGTAEKLAHHPIPMKWRLTECHHRSA